MGVISILMDKRYDLSLNDLLTHEVPIDKKILKDLMGFLEQRLDFFLQSDGHPADAVSSVMGFAPDMPPYRIRELLEALLQARRNTEFDEFLLAAKRINNIAPKERVPAVNRKLFSQKEESDLYDGYEKLSGQLKDLLSTGQYETSLSLLLTLTGPINRFFDKVLIMDKDDQVRMNRLSLIKDVKTLIMQVSDFSRLTGRP
jgi:glycyl-tRNA synthetase beta chain